MTDESPTLQDESPLASAPTPGLIRIVIADDHPIFRDGLRKLLSLEDDFEVVGEARDGNEVLEIMREKEADVLLLDLRMPGLDGLSVLQSLKNSGCRSRITGHSNARPVWTSAR